MAFGLLLRPQLHPRLCTSSTGTPAVFSKACCPCHVAQCCPIFAFGSRPNCCKASGCRWSASYVQRCSMHCNALWRPTIYLHKKKIAQTFQHLTTLNKAEQFFFLKKKLYTTLHNFATLLQTCSKQFRILRNYTRL